MCLFFMRNNKDQPDQNLTLCKHFATTLQLKFNKYFKSDKQ